MIKTLAAIYFIDIFCFKLKVNPDKTQTLKITFNIYEASIEYKRDSPGCLINPIGIVLNRVPIKN